MAGNFFQNAFEKTKSLANQAVDSTKCAAQKTKIKGKISSENSNLDRIYTEIGRYYYNLNKEEAPEEIKHLFDSAAKGLENIAALEKEYREVEEQEHRIMNSGNQYQQTPPQGMYNPQMNGMPPQGMYNPQMAAVSIIHRQWNRRRQDGKKALHSYMRTHTGISYTLQ